MRGPPGPQVTDRECARQQVAKAPRPVIRVEHEVWTASLQQKLAATAARHEWCAVTSHDANGHKRPSPDGALGADEAALGAQG